jgi:pSer/pThr/pTyr-binding forkhead associated (FHA) protein
MKTAAPMSDTICGGSNVGKRLRKLQRHEDLRISGVGRDVPIVGRITIGRENDNTIQLDDALVSRHHALVHRIANDYFVKDLESTNGTFVNGTPVPWGKYARLRQGDILRIGRTELKLH